MVPAGGYRVSGARKWALGLLFEGSARRVGNLGQGPLGERRLGRVCHER